MAGALGVPTPSLDGRGTTRTTITGGAGTVAAVGVTGIVVGGGSSPPAALAIARIAMRKTAAHEPVTPIRVASAGARRRRRVGGRLRVGTVGGRAGHRTGIRRDRRDRLAPSRSGRRPAAARDWRAGRRAGRRGPRRRQSSLPWPWWSSRRRDRRRGRRRRGHRGGGGDRRHRRDRRRRSSCPARCPPVPWAPGGDAAGAVGRRGDGGGVVVSAPVSWSSNTVTTTVLAGAVADGIDGALDGGGGRRRAVVAEGGDGDRAGREHHRDGGRGGDCKSTFHEGDTTRAARGLGRCSFTLRAMAGRGPDPTAGAAASCQGW